MEIEILPPDNNDREKLYQAMKEAERQETIGCLLVGLLMLVMAFAFLAMLPVLLVILGYTIAFTAIYLVYKMWLEQPLLNFIQKHHLKKK
jgi:hypothetical protein